MRDARNLRSRPGLYQVGRRPRRSRQLSRKRFVPVVQQLQFVSPLHPRRPQTPPAPLMYSTYNYPIQPPQLVDGDVVDLSAHVHITTQPRLFPRCT